MNAAALPEFVFGIDPGIFGAVALIRRLLPQPDDPPIMVRLRLMSVDDVPITKAVTGRNEVSLIGVQELFDFGDKPKADAYIEDVHAAPGQGVSSMFRFGYATGALASACVAHGHTLRRITPQHWQHMANATGAPSLADPNNARARAAKLFPEQAALFERVKDHNRADAVLIAYAGFMELMLEPR